MTQPTFKSVPPLTPEQKMAYSIRLQEFATQMEQEGDHYSAEINSWMADNYSRLTKS
jgi:hypothetical protein